MKALEELQIMTKGLEDKEIHSGYWYSIGNTLTILICGMLCGLKTIDDIHDWAISSPSRELLKIERIFSRAQFYNILKVVDSEKFKLAFY